MQSLGHNDFNGSGVNSFFQISNIFADKKASMLDFLSNIFEKVFKIGVKLFQGFKAKILSINWTDVCIAFFIKKVYKSPKPQRKADLQGQQHICSHLNCVGGHVQHVLTEAQQQQARKIINKTSYFHIEGHFIEERNDIEENCINDDEQISQKNSFAQLSQEPTQTIINETKHFYIKGNYVVKNKSKGRSSPFQNKMRHGAVQTRYIGHNYFNSDMRQSFAG